MWSDIASGAAESLAQSAGDGDDFHLSTYVPTRDIVERSELMAAQRVLVLSSRGGGKVLVNVREIPIEGDHQNCCFGTTPMTKDYPL